MSINLIAMCSDGLVFGVMSPDFMYAAQPATTTRTQSGNNMSEGPLWTVILGFFL